MFTACRQRGTQHPVLLRACPRPRRVQVLTLDSCDFPPGVLLELASLPSLEHLHLCCCDAALRSAYAWAVLLELCARSRSLTQVIIKVVEDFDLAPPEDGAADGIAMPGGAAAFPWLHAAKQVSAGLALRGRADVAIGLSSY